LTTRVPLLISCDLIKKPVSFTEFVRPTMELAIGLEPTTC
jgi:hypothetical protein